MSWFSVIQFGVPNSVQLSKAHHEYPAIQTRSLMEVDTPCRMVCPEKIAIDPDGYRHWIPREYSSSTVRASLPNETKTSEYCGPPLWPSLWAGDDQFEITDTAWNVKPHGAIKFLSPLQSESLSRLSRFSAYKSGWTTDSMADMIAAIFPMSFTQRWQLLGMPFGIPVPPRSVTLAFISSVRRYRHDWYY